MAGARQPLKGSDLATIAFGVLGIGIWWFLSSNPSKEMIFFAAIGLGLIAVIFCAFSVLFPASGNKSETKDQAGPEKAEPGPAVVTKK